MVNYKTWNVKLLYATNKAKFLSLISFVPKLGKASLLMHDDEPNLRFAYRIVGHYSFISYWSNKVEFAKVDV